MSGERILANLKKSGYRIALTGGTSWLGQATLMLLENLFGDDLPDRVYCFGSAAKALRLPSGRMIKSRSLSEITELPQADYLFLHYAFVTKGYVALKSIEDYTQLNKHIADLVEAAAHRVSAKGFFLPSSGAVYRPDRTLCRTLEENPYGFLKLKDERRFTAMAAEIGCNLSTIRIFNLAGPCMNNLDGYALSSIIMNVLGGEPVRLRANKSVWRSYVHVLDVVVFALAEIFCGAAQAPLDTAGQSQIEVGDLAHQITAIMGLPNCPILRPAITDPEDRYVGDGAAFHSRAEVHKLQLRPLATQIEDTILDLKARLLNN
jgi:nucleoside-diphosphate-sugar epimerase